MAEATIRQTELMTQVITAGFQNLLLETNRKGRSAHQQWREIQFEWQFSIEWTELEVEF